MNSLPLKILAGTAAIGSIGTATYFGGKELFRSSTIKEHLNSKKFKFISLTNDRQWEAEFKSDEDAIKNFLGNPQANSDSLKEWCNSRLNLSSDNKKDLDNVKKWCIIRDINS